MSKKRLADSVMTLICKIGGMHWHDAIKKAMKKGKPELEQVPNPATKKGQKQDDQQED